MANPLGSMPQPTQQTTGRVVGTGAAYQGRVSDKPAPGPVISIRDFN
jgi:hypothetical protein